MDSNTTGRTATVVEEGVVINATLPTVGVVEVRTVSTIDPLASVVDNSASIAPSMAIQKMLPLVETPVSTEGLLTGAGMRVAAKNSLHGSCPATAIHSGLFISLSQNLLLKNSQNQNLFKNSNFTNITNESFTSSLNKTDILFHIYFDNVILDRDLFHTLPLYEIYDNFKDIKITRGTLLKEDNFVLHHLPMPKDGNCLFHSLTKSLETYEPAVFTDLRQKATLKSLPTHIYLRRLIVRFVELNRKYFEDSLIVDYSSFEEYTTKMKMDGTFGDHTELISFSTIFNMNVIIVRNSEHNSITNNFDIQPNIQRDIVFETTYHENKNLTNIAILYHPNQVHYDTFVDRQESIKSYNVTKTIIENHIELSKVADRTKDSNSMKHQAKQEHLWSLQKLNSLSADEIKSISKGKNRKNITKPISLYKRMQKSGQLIVTEEEEFVFEKLSKPKTKREKVSDAIKTHCVISVLDLYKKNFSQVTKMSKIAFNTDTATIQSHYIGTLSKSCPHCGALLFPKETSSLCCDNSTTSVHAQPEPPQLIKDLLDPVNERHRDFMDNIRLINSMFQMASSGIQIKQFNNGCHFFTLQGQIYHRIGGIIPSEAQAPGFLQLYIVEADRELDNRQAILESSLSKVEFIISLFKKCF